MEISNEIARQLLDAASDPSIVVDRDGTIIYANARVTDVLGYDPAELVDAHLEVLLPERFRDIHPGHRLGYFDKPSPRPMGTDLELFALRKDGTEIPVEISLNTVKVPGRPLVCASLRDVSNQRSLERELKEANRAKSRFLAAASHDLRQPIAAMGLFNEVARKLAADPQLQSVIEKQKRSIDSMAHLLNAILDISKLEAGIVKADITDCAVHEIFNDLRAEFEEQAKLKGLDLVVDNCRDVARSDPRLLTQILENLVANAIQYTREGLVRLQCIHEKLWIRIQVVDTGLGISPDDLENIFDEFHQADAGSSRPDGLGLGLSIVKHTARLLGCELEVRSTLGQGSVFSVSVPRGVESEVSAAAEKTHAAPELGGGHILVVDDEPALIDAIGILLRIEGFDVVTAASEAEALAATRGVALDLIVTDYHLRGGKTGLDVIRSLREEIRSDLPAIVVSGDTSDRVPVDEFDKTVFLSKPVDPTELLRQAREQIEVA